MSSLSAETVWENCLSVLRHRLSQEALSTWLLPLRPSLKKNQHGLSFCLSGNTSYCVNWVDKHYKHMIRDSLGTIPGGAAMQLEVRADHGIPSTGGLADNGLNPQYTFDNFVRGPSNDFAYQSAWGIATCDEINNRTNPLLLYSESGLGKTHLLMASGNEIRRRAPERRVLYMTSEQFYKGVVRSIQNKTMDAFNDLCRNVDVLLIDDIHFLMNKERCQVELFNTFNDLWGRHRQIIFSADRDPLQVDLDERLRSRLMGGLPIKLMPPELETRIAILCAKAKQNWKCELSAEVAHFIADKISFNVRELEGALNTVYSYARNSEKQIDLPLVQQALRDSLSGYAQAVSMETIQKAVATYYAVDVALLMAAQRSRVLVRPRHMAMALARELTSLSLPEIGRNFGGRDHTTVMNACRRIKELRNQDGGVENAYQTLSRLLRHHRSGNINNSSKM